MPYKFLEEESVADVAFEATGKTFQELLESCALAVTNTMIKDLQKISDKIEKKISIEADNSEMLVYKFLEELIFYKDAEQLLFNKFKISLIPKNKRWKLEATAWGEKINPEKHEQLVDVKAVTFHHFEVREINNGWYAHIILDV